MEGTPAEPTTVEPTGEPAAPAPVETGGFEITDEVLIALGAERDADGNLWLVNREVVVDPQTGAARMLKYRDPDAVFKALEDKERHFYNMENRLVQSAEREAALRAQLAERESTLSRFSESVPQEQIDAIMIQQYLEAEHPEFKGISNIDSLANDPQQQQKWLNARTNAAARVMVERQQREAQAKEAARQRDAAFAAGENFLTELQSQDPQKLYSNWGVSNTEQVAALGDFLDSPSGRQLSDGTQLTLGDELQWVHAAMGEQVARIYHAGLRASFAESFNKAKPAVLPNTPAAPQAAPEPTPATPQTVVGGPSSVQPENPPQPQVEKVIPGTSAQPPAAPASSVDQPLKVSGRQALRAGMAAAVRAPQGIAVQVNRGR